MFSQANSTKHTKNNIDPSKLFQKTKEEGNFPKSFHEATITLIPKPDKDNTQTENYWPILLMNRCKNPQQNTSKLNTIIH